MSDPKLQEELAELREGLAKAEELQKIKNENNERKTIIDSMRTTVELERLEQDKRDLEAIRTANFDELTDEQVSDLQREHSAYLEAASGIMGFIHACFKNIIPVFEKNLILIGAKTGDGKSTAAANIIYSLLAQKNPKTNKQRRILLMSNEENVTDVYARTIALGKKWPYTSHDKFTTEQAEAFRQGIKALAKGGRLTVVQDNFNGARGLTTTPEGIKMMFDSLIERKIWYDVIIIDYYQNFKESKKDAKADAWKVQAELCEVLDKYKNLYPAPIILFAQMEPPTQVNPKPYELRFQGRKLITTKATCIIEMTKNKDDYTTDFKIHKNRFNGDSVNEIIVCGFDKGRYVENNDAFKEMVQKWKDRREEQTLNKELGQEEGKKLKERMEKIEEPK